MSGVGKGVATASIGAMLKARGLRVTAVKIDPYLNVDPGTMNPVEHGEVFVTKDGLETDQDIGNYERFLDVDLYRENCMTSGSVYQAVISRERALGYGGRTVEAVPHIPQEVISRIRAAAKKADADVTLIEIGGTVGEYQNVLYLEACRMMRLASPKNIALVLVSYLPVPGSIGEMKSKPTQYAVRTLNGTGLQPDLLICRSTHPIDLPRKQKLSLNCNVAAEDVIAAPDVASIYQVPLHFESERVADRLMKKLGLRARKPNLAPWKHLETRLANGSKTVRIGVVGKYFSTGNFVLTDSYLSVLEAIKHAGWALHARSEIVWLNSEELELKGSSPSKFLNGLDGILIPGGFGTRGVEGKLKAVRYAREKNIPYLGLCYGMQLACVEFARNVLGWKDAQTTEIHAGTTHPVIQLMNEQSEKMKDKNYGGSMRLGAYPCVLANGSMARRLYRTNEIFERHRHRYEFNVAYRDMFEQKGFRISGTSPDGKLAELIEIPTHPFFMASQFHPELQSRPFHAHPLFVGFIRAAMGVR